MNTVTDPPAHPTNRRGRRTPTWINWVLALFTVPVAAAVHREAAAGDRGAVIRLGTTDR